MSCRLITLLFFVLLPVAPLTLPATIFAEQYTFGLIPQESAVQMHKRWYPFVDQLQKETGLEFKIKIFETVAKFEDSFLAGALDFVYLNSTQQVTAWKSQGYIPLIRSKRFLRGAIFVRNDSPFQSLNDLKGMRIAFVSEKSLCDIALGHALKTDYNNLNYIPVYVNSASNVYKNVLLKKTSAGGTLDISINSAEPSVAKQLRAIYLTPEMASHPISAHPRIPIPVQKTLTDGVNTIANSPSGQELLRTVRLPPPLVSADFERDYKWLEAYLE
nr:phosphate/phosphite/phosphonate ABC transporter substrate-binding protein [Desulfobulbaceae bacterium]